MPNTKSAAKRLRQNIRRRARNRAVKHTVKTHYKRVIAAIQKGDLQLAEQEFRQAVKKIDQAAAKGVIHKNKAARLKSRLAQRLGQASSAGSRPA